ncbi:hypothetical protein LCGC14_1728150 [marine sediment metagenome]|uniref:SUF system Fe-S cluster assembly regulator n=1 Tax=marine sediment metagenome TaxID=412755 RepID=A0A0F9HY54_9ZZZZ|nr:SUF system Fe-S cluster assembly regulator [Porticoccus sp.]
MLRVSKLTDYGSVILAYMARHPGQTLSATSLSQAVYMPLATVSKLLKLFKKNGLVQSSRGKRGGYRLSRPAEKISLAEIISVLEGPIALTECSVKKDLCQIESHCAIRPSWQNINRVIYNSLSQVTLETMLATNLENTTEPQPITLIGQ